MKICLRLTIYLLLLTSATQLFAQSKRGFKILKQDKKEWPKAWEAFAQDTNNAKATAAAYYGLAKSLEPKTKNSLDTILLCAAYVQKAETLLRNGNKEVQKFAKKHKVNLFACNGYLKRLETAGWSYIEKNGDFELLENFRRTFPDFFKKNKSEKAEETQKRIVRQAYKDAHDYATLSRLIKGYRKYLYEDNITMDSNLDGKLWSAYTSEENFENFGQFIEDHPAHWASYDCWSADCAKALQDGSLQALVRFADNFPNSYLSYSPVGWHILEKYESDAAAAGALSETEKLRFEEIIATCRMINELSYRPDAPADLTLLIGQIRKGAPSWGAWTLMKSSLDNFLAAKDWDNALELVKACKPLFPNISPDRCRVFYYRRQDWFETMEKILNAPFEPLDPKPIAELNTGGNEVLPLVSPDGKKLIFTGEGRPDGLRKEDPYEVPFHDGVFGKPELIKGLAGEHNESLLSVTADGSEALVFVDGKLHMSKMTEKGWTKPEKLPDPLNDFAWVGKASYNADGTVILFEAIAEKPSAAGSNPNMDIYVALRDAKGAWQKPFPLPSNINTRFRERSPYLHVDGETLYFSSNGHMGFGQMDVLKTKRLDKTWMRWEDPENMGKEINTIEDDWGFNFSVSADGKTAFFSQNDDLNRRRGELMMAGLPKRIRPKAVRILEVPVKSAATMQVQLLDRNGVVLQTVPVQSGKKAVFVVEEAEEIVTAVPKGDNIIAQPIDFDLTKPPASRPDTLKAVTIQELLDTKSVFQLPDVRFDRSESVLRPDAMQSLDKFFRAVASKKLKVTITGHTDDNGTEEANQILSEDRAKVVRDYLVRLGYPDALITTEGKGESLPKVPNDSEFNRSINRRVEFRIMK